MRKIASAIGYSATSIYLHFENKDALYHALIEEGMDKMLAQLQAAVASHRDNPLAQLRALCQRYIDFGVENPEVYEIMFMLHPEHMERYPAAKYRRARRNLDLIARTLEEGARHGVFRLGDANVVASAIWSSLHGAVALLLARRIDVRIDKAAFVEHVIEQTLYGVVEPRL
jgi:AcrR family transcriptional regulator